MPQHPHPLWLSGIVLLLLAVWTPPAMAGGDSLLQAHALIEQVGQLQRQGRHAAALPLALEALGLLETAIGPDSGEVAAACSIAAGMYDALEDYGPAVPLYERALAIQEKTLGPKHPVVAATLANLAWAIDALGDPAKARPYYERTLAIREEVLGPDHPDVAVSLNNLAFLEESFGEHGAAKAHYERALAINDRILGPQHPETANSLNNLAGVLVSLAQYAQARTLYERALAIQEKILGPTDIKLAASLNNMAQLERTVGAYEKARHLLERSQAIRETALGPHHPDTALGRNNLAGLLDLLGEYDQAKPLYEQSLADLEKSLGPRHPHVAACLANLASVVASMGDVQAAMAMLERSIAIWEEARGPQNEEVARPLHNLALLHYAQGDYAQAGRLLDRTRRILETALPEGHPLLATVENSQAAIAVAEGRLDLAKAQNEHVLALREKVLGPRHLETAISLSNLAGVLVDLGEAQQAVALYERSLSIMEEALGPSHPSTAKVLSNLARIQARAGNRQLALSLMRRVQDIDAGSIEPIMGIASDAQKLNYLATLEANLHDFQSLVAGSFANDPEARRAAFSAWLGRKGIVLESQRRFQDALFHEADAETRRLAEELAVVRGQLSRLTFSGPANLSAQALKEETAALRTQKERLEAELSTRAKRYARARKRDGATLAGLAAALPPESVLLDFCRYEVSDFTAPKRKTGTFRYLAYLLPAGHPEQLALIDLGDAATIDQAVVTFKTAMKQPADAGGQAAARASRALYEGVFAPLRQGLGQSRSLFISPDGNLNLIPFEVLLGPDQRYVIEDFTCNYLSAGRELLDFAPMPHAQGKAVLFGNPDFNRRAGNTPQTKSDPAARTPGSVSRDMAELRFSRLPGTRDEVVAVAGLLGAENVQVFVDSQADEAALSSLSGPRILHLATHGFFLGDQTLARLLGRNKDDGNFPPGLPPRGLQGFENPLLRSGLALAGANTALAGKGMAEGGGIVTAEKILGLPLAATEMVVLSACETGVGEVRAGEGVFGLRRVFAQAGARSLVMSLWSVPDLETKELMVNFYRHLGEKGGSRSAALRQAVLEEMAIVRQRYGQPNPFFWGAFVFLGQP